MRHVLISFFLYILLISEGVAVDVLPTQILEGPTLITSHWVYGFLMLIVLFSRNKDAYVYFVYALVFGLIKDIVYTDMLGIYMFTYPLTLYFIYQFKKVFTINFSTTVLIGLIGFLVTDTIVYAIYFVVDVTEMAFQSYTYYRLLPTVLANIIFLMVLYPVVKKLKQYWQKNETIS